MTFRRVVAALVVAAVAAACSGGGDPDPVSRASVSPSPGLSAGPDASAAPIFEADDRVLDVAVEDPLTLDPIRIQNHAALLVARQLYEGLTRWDQSAEAVVPAAAESWTAGDGGATFTFRLRAGMTFHDGTPVTAADFVYAFDRLALKANASEIAYVLERVVGFDEVNRDGTAEHLSGLDARGDLTLVIRLDRPYYDLPAVLTHPALVPLAAHSVADAAGFVRTPNGNGPFQIAQAWAPGDQVVMTAFPGFYETPSIDGLRFVTYADAAASWLQFLDGELDVARVPAGQEASAREIAGERGFLPTLGGYFFGFNLDRVVEPRVRAAINLAIDRAAIAREVYRGNLQPPRGIVPSSIPGFVENVCFEVCDFRPDEARRIVRSLPRDDRAVQLQFTAGDPHGQIAKLVANDLRKAGFSPTVRSYPFPRFVELLEADEHEMFRFGWIAEYPVADVFLDPLFSSTAPDNETNFALAKVDELLRRAHAEPAPGRRTQLYIAAEKAILKHLPVVPIGTFVTEWAAQPAVEDIAFDVMGGFDAVSVFLEPDASPAP